MSLSFFSILYERIFSQGYFRRSSQLNYYQSSTCHRKSRCSSRTIAENTVRGTWQKNLWLNIKLTSTVLKNVFAPNSRPSRNSPSCHTTELFVSEKRARMLHSREPLWNRTLMINLIEISAWGQCCKTNQETVYMYVSTHSPFLSNYTAKSFNVSWHNNLLFYATRTFKNNLKRN